MSKELDSSDHAQNLKSGNFSENYNILILTNQTACDQSNLNYNRKDRVVVETGVLQFLQITPATNYVN